MGNLCIADGCRCSYFIWEGDEHCSRNSRNLNHLGMDSRYVADLSSWQLQLAALQQNVHALCQHPHVEPSISKSVHATWNTNINLLVSTFDFKKIVPMCWEKLLSVQAGWLWRFWLDCTRFQGSLMRAQLVCGPDTSISVTVLLLWPWRLPHQSCLPELIWVCWRELFSEDKQHTCKPWAYF